MNGETKFFAGVVAITVVILIGAALILTKPQPPLSRDKLVPSQAHTTGNPSAKVTLVEFGDYECPACGQVYPAVKQIIDDYKDKMNFVFRNFPLDQHPNSHLAAEAAEAAAVQGKFWEMHDLLYRNQTNLSFETVKKLATDLKMDVDKFASEVAQKKYKDTIDADVAAASALGINATPTFYLNGRKLPSQVDFKAEVEKALEEAK